MESCRKNKDRMKKVVQLDTLSCVLSIFSVFVGPRDKTVSESLTLNLLFMSGVLWPRTDNSDHLHCFSPLLHINVHHTLDAGALKRAHTHIQSCAKWSNTQLAQTANSVINTRATVRVHRVY